MFTALFALFSLFSSRAYIGKSELEVQVSQQLRLLDQKIIGQEWEWARNISIVYTWVVCKMLQYFLDMLAYNTDNRMDQKANSEPDEY